MFTFEEGCKWGRQFYSCDYNELSFALYNKLKVIALDDNSDRYRRIGCTMMSILLPPYAAIEAELNRDFLTAQDIYRNYLLGPDPTAALAAIMTALYAELDIVLFVSPDEAKSLQFSGVLCEYLMKAFGLPCASLSSQNTYPFLSDEPCHVANRLALMYAYGYIPFDAFVDSHPFIMPLEIVIPRVAHDTQTPELMNMNRTEAIQYCGDIILTCQKHRREWYTKSHDVGKTVNFVTPIVELHDFQRKL